MSKNYHRKIRVAIFSMPMNSRGGGFDIIRNWLLTLDKNIFDVHLVCFSYCHDILQENLKDVPNIKFIHIDQLDSLKFLYIPGIRRLSAYLMKEKIDVIHTVMIQADILGGIAARLARVPVSVSTVIGYLINPTPGSSATLKTFVYKFMYWLTKDRFDKIIGISKATLEELKRDFGVREEVLEVNYCGIKLDKEATRKIKRQSSENLVVGTIGELIPPKGMGVFIDAIPHILKEHPTTKFIIAGDGPERPVLEEMTNKLGIEKHIRFLGWVTNAREVIESMDIFVFPSLPMYDGLPRVILEAWAMGTPVITTKVACIEEIIRHGKDGLIIPAGDPMEISLSVNKLIYDRDRAEVMAKLAFERVREFDKNWEVDKMEEIYLSLLKKTVDSVLTGK